MFPGLRDIRNLAFVISLIEFLASLAILFKFKTGVAGLQFVEDVSWIPAIGARYKMGIDGISVYLLLLTTFISPIAILASFQYIKKRQKEFYVAMLVLEAALVGVFCAVDLLLFYIFWEAILIPMYLIIGVWGGERRIYAAVKFFLFTMVGSLLMFLAILYCYFRADPNTFDVFTLYTALQVLSPREQFFLFGAFALSFAIKVPMFPLHTWLPDAHVEAPTAGSVILAGVLLKMGTYGFLRFAIPFFPKGLVYVVQIPLFGGVNFLGFLTVLSVIGIIYGALMALAQDDIKKLIAYSSVSHLGFVMLGLLALNLHGISGGVYQMLNHGISTGALFLLVGMLYERRHTREIVDYGGIAKKIPIFSAIFMIVTLSSIGLPGTNGFVGEFTILLGMFAADPWYAIFSASGVILGAVYMLWMVQRVFFGRVTNPENENLPDTSQRELVVLVPIVILIFVMGIFPTYFFKRIQPSVRRVIDHVRLEIDKTPSATAPREPAGLEELQ
ncbi:MAG: complex I subunit 4 family protein [Planctomycetota bacterium]|jgi:NADH-quinone oxidoreductase subunit M